MVKTIPLKYSDEEHAALVQIKNESGLSWDKFFIQAAKAYARENNV